VNRKERPKARAGSVARPIAYVTPYRMPTNRYMEFQKALANASGYEPRPFSIKHLFFEGGLWGLLERRNIVLCQWLETRPFVARATGSSLRLSPVGLALYLVFLTLLAVTPATVIYVVHDHAVNDAEGALHALSQWFLFTARRVANHRVVHDPGCQQQYQASYLPHPLFWDREEPPGSLSPMPLRGRAPARAAGAPLRCAMLGAIRPYKAIDQVLREWPAGMPLMVAGRCSAGLLSSLQNIIKARGLQHTVTVYPKHLSDAEFDHEIDAADVFVLPHASNTALVSGAFFEAIGRVPVIVARRSPFIDWAATQFDGVYAFDAADELPGLLQRVASDSACADGATRARTALAARAAFGHDACRLAWGDFFLSIGCSSSRPTKRLSA
jgi:beta-1,4-mannosyltransferase